MKTCITLFLLSFLMMLIAKPANAQQNLKLSEITKFELTIAGGGLTTDFRSLEIVPENKSWSCYQTKLVGYDRKKGMLVNDSLRTFIEDVPPTVLNNLLKMINKPDTAFDLKLFNINKEELIKGLDSLQTHLPAAEKARITEAIYSRDAIHRALHNLYHPLLKWDDKTQSDIRIITKANTIITLYATNFGYLDFEPWHIIKQISYNPNLAIIFETIAGDDQYQRKARKRFISEIDRELYFQFFNIRTNNMLIQPPLNLHQ